MDYENLKNELKEIAAVVDSVPEAFRARCFELLLEHLLSGDARRRVAEHKQEQARDTEMRPTPLPTQVRVFLKRTDLSEDDLRKVAEVIDGQAHILKEPTPDGVAAGQIQWALLLALKNALEGRDLAVDPEAVRSTCIEKGFYDKPNFARNFKTKQVLFKGALESQGEAQALSPTGEKELAALVRELAVGR